MDAKSKRGVFNIHGSILEVTSRHPAFDKALENVLWSFETNSDAAPAFSIDLRAIASPEDAPTDIPPEASVVYTKRTQDTHDPLDPGIDFDIYRSRNEVIMDLGDRGILRIDLESGKASAYLSSIEDLHLDVLGSLLLFMVVELLKCNKQFLVHAAALCKDGRGILIPGTRGRGKTTCCLGLLKGGFKFLSDDVTFLMEVEDRVELRSFPERVSVSDHTIEMFPELRTIGGELQEGFQKKHFVVDDMFPNARVERCLPGLILFPKIIESPRSYTEPMPKSRALEELMPHAISVLDKDASRELFSLLGRVVADSECYRLHFGGDVERLPQIVSDLLDAGPG